MSHLGCIVKEVFVKLDFLCFLCPHHRGYFIRSLLRVVVEVLIGCDARIVPFHWTWLLRKGVSSGNGIVKAQRYLLWYYGGFRVTLLVMGHLSYIPGCVHIVAGSLSY
jgi:hypothetical protein